MPHEKNVWRKNNLSGYGSPGPWAGFHALSYRTPWTTPRDAGEIERVLQSSGIATHAVLDTEDLFADEQLRQRNHYLTISHPIHKTITIEASRSKLSRTPARIPSAGLTFGSQYRFVLSSILGYCRQRISELETRGVLQ